MNERCGVVVLDRSALQRLRRQIEHVFRGMPPRKQNTGGRRGEPKGAFVKRRPLMAYRRGDDGPPSRHTAGVREPASL